jgi:heme/copper-type cytochrome/quinol oxidase subunit 2
VKQNDEEWAWDRRRFAKLKIDVQVPKSGDAIRVEFTAPPAGRYEIACSEFCRSGHGQMKAALVSLDPAQTSR